MMPGSKKVESSRTILDFQFKSEINPIVEKWADENSFLSRTNLEGAIEYRRRGGMSMCPVIVQVKQSDNRVHLETWLEVDLLTEFITLFNAPAQSAIDSKTQSLWRERDIARWYVNKLLKELGQPQIE